MPVLEYGESLRLVVGELTRRDQLELSRDALHAGLSDLDGLDVLIWINNQVASRAIHSVQVLEGGAWAALAAGDERAILTPDGTTFGVSFPMRPALLDGLPASFADRLMTAVKDSNAYIIGYLDFLPAAATATTDATSSAPPSASVPSTPPNAAATSRPTKTTGRSATPTT